MRGKQWARMVGAAVVLMLAGAACGRSTDEEVLVAAAASLTDVFAEMATEFEQSNPGTDIVFNLAGSTLLREQILEGAPVEVFAAANQSAMERVEQAGRLDGPARVFAQNRMVLAVPAGNPAGVTGLEDLARPGILVGLCSQQVPCGDFAEQILGSAGVTASVDTREVNVRALSTKISVGELDAGIVYATDAEAIRGVEAVEISENHNVVAQYPIAVVNGTDNLAGARAFVDFVLSDAGRRILSAHGFALP